MSFFDSFEVAWSALRANLLRSILTTLGIIIGVASVIVLVAVGAGARQDVETRIASLGTNMLVVYSGSSRVRGRAGGEGTDKELSEAPPPLSETTNRLRWSRMSCSTSSERSMPIIAA